jgi:iron complex outermembrane receptor protein
MVSRVVVAGSVLAFAWIAAAPAQAVMKHRIDIPRQQLGSALAALARQTGIQLVYTTDLVEGRSAEALSGSLTSEEALRQLLAATGLNFEFIDAETVTLSKASGTSVPPKTSAVLRDELFEARGNERAPTEGPAPLGRSRLAQGASASSTGPEPRADETEGLQEIVVTGTSIRGAEQPVGSSLLSVNRESIAVVGARTTTEILATIPQMGFFNGLPRPAATNTSLSTPVDLRGLGTTATLVLIDGQRLVGDSPLTLYANPSSVPPAAIERIEIVPDGASAIYGSDAVGGVINIITRKNLNGAETTARYGSGRGPYDALDFSQALGRVWDSGSAMLVAAYSKNDNLRQGDLDFFTNDLRAFGGTDLRPFNCPNPNIRIGNATSGTVYAAPNYTTTYPAAAIGDAARCDPASLGDLYSAQESFSVVGNVHQEFSDTLRGYADVKFSRLEATTIYPPTSATITINSSNPFFRAPPGTTATSETLLYNVQSLQGAPEFTAVGKSGNAIAGLDYDIGKWQLSGSVNYGWSDSNIPGSSSTTGYNLAALTAAAAGTTTATALDPFGNGTNPAVAAAIADWVGVITAEQELFDYQAKADGPIFDLPGGAVRAAFGIDYLKMNYDATQANGPSGTAPQGVSSGTRSVKSVFGEVLIPIFGGDLTLPALQSLSLSAAVRADDYSDFGSTTNPKFGLSWVPIGGLTVRGNFGTSFHAPDMGSVYAVDTRAVWQPNQAVQPPGNPTGNAILLAGGRTNLEPETADTYSVGLDWKPASIPGLALSTTYYDIDFEDQIVVPPAGPALFTNAAYADLWDVSPSPAQIADAIAGLRLDGFPAGFDPTSVVLLYDRRRTNLSATHTNGIDLDFNYHWESGLAAWAATLAGNRVLTIEKQGSATAAFVEDRAVPQWRVRAGLSVTRGPWSAGANVNYLDSFEFTYASGAGGTAVQDVDAFTTVDLHSSYRVPIEAGFFSGVTFSLNVNNLLNEDPPLQISAGGYTSLANPLGRMVWVGMQKNFGW